MLNSKMSDFAEFQTGQMLGVCLVETYVAITISVMNVSRVMVSKNCDLISATTKTVPARHNCRCIQKLTEGSRLTI